MQSLKQTNKQTDRHLPGITSKNVSYINYHAGDPPSLTGEHSTSTGHIGNTMAGVFCDRKQTHFEGRNWTKMFYQIVLLLKGLCKKIFVLSRNYNNTAFT